MIGLCRANCLWATSFFRRCIIPAEAHCQANRGINAVGLRKLTKYCDSFRFLELFCVYFYWDGTVLHLSDISTRDCISAILAFTGASNADSCCSVAFFAYDVYKACFAVLSARKKHTRRSLLLQCTIPKDAFSEKPFKLGERLIGRFSRLL